MGKKQKRPREHFASDLHGQNKTRAGRPHEKQTEGKDIEPSLPSWVSLGGSLGVPGLCEGGNRSKQGARCDTDNDSNNE